MKAQPYVETFLRNFLASAIALWRTLRASARASLRILRASANASL